MLFTATASSLSFPVRLTWKPKLSEGANSKKIHAAPFEIALMVPKRSVPVQTASLWGFEQDV